MKPYVTLFLLFLLLILGCKTRKAVDENVVKSSVVNSNINARIFTINSNPDINMMYQLYKVNSLNLIDQHLVIEVQYSGGCVKPHEFELVSTGVVNKDGVMDFTLLHKTTTDKCKALIMENLDYDLSPLYDLKSNVLKKISINQGEPIAL